MPPIRVALCITDLDVGGAERCLQNLAIGLERARFDPVVYCLGPRPKNREASCVELIESAGIPVHCLEASKPWHFTRTLRRLTGLLTSQSPQILQSFLFHANFMGRLAGRRAGVPHILSGIRVAERHSWWHLMLDRWTQGMVERHVCVSTGVAKFSASEAGLARDGLVVIPNGIDCDSVAATQPIDLADLGLPPGRRVITFVGRLEPQKGLPWLLETAVGWLPNVPGHDLLLVGAGPQETSLRDLIGQLGISDRVHLAGWRADVLEILRASDMLVLPSLWEGMPNVVLQAMALGLPVLATRVEGTCELLGDLSGPQTTPYGETQVFSEKLVAILSTPSEAARLGTANQLRARQKFSLAEMVHAYEDLWQGLTCP